MEIITNGRTIRGIDDTSTSVLNKTPSVSNNAHQKGTSGNKNDKNDSMHITVGLYKALFIYDIIAMFLSIGIIILLPFFMDLEVLFMIIVSIVAFIVLLTMIPILVFPWHTYLVLNKRKNTSYHWCLYTMILFILLSISSIVYSINLLTTELPIFIDDIILKLSTIGGMFFGIQTLILHIIGLIHLKRDNMSRYLQLNNPQNRGGSAFAPVIVYLYGFCWVAQIIASIIHLFL